MEVSLVELEERLQYPVPRGYVEFVRGSDPTSLWTRGFDPKTLCVLNLTLREIDNDGWTKCRFFLSGDGCGNYFFVPVPSEGSSDRVLLWSHDPPGIEDAGADLPIFLSSRLQEDPILDSPRPGSFCIANGQRRRIHPRSYLLGGMAGGRRIMRRGSVSRLRRN